MQVRGAGREEGQVEFAYPDGARVRLTHADAPSLLAEVAADDNLRAIAGANSRADFAFAPGLQMVTEDAVWQVEDSSNAVLEELRGMPWERLREMLLDCGLYERLQA